MFNRVKILLFCRRKNPVYVVRIEKEDNHLPVPVSAEEIALKHAIDEIYNAGTACPARFAAARIKITIEQRQPERIGGQTTSLEHQTDPAQTPIRRLRDYRLAAAPRPEYLPRLRAYPPGPDAIDPARSGQLVVPCRRDRHHHRRDPGGLSVSYTHLTLPTSDLV